MNAVIELEIGPGPSVGTYSAHILQSLTGAEPSVVITLDIDDVLASLPQIEAGVLASSVSARRVMSTRESVVRAIGVRLFDATFTGKIGETYRASAAVAAERGLSPQVTLRLTAPELAALPWEALFDTESGRYISRREPLVRRVASASSARPDPIVAPLRILGMVSSPRGLEVLDVGAEKERLTSALEEHLAAGRVELVWLEDTSWGGLHTMLLQETWHILHFIGHGGYDPRTDEGLLAFVGRDGRADLVPASNLADLLNEAESTPRLVVLNSCQSGVTGTSDLFAGTAATLVHSGINAVVAMQFAVSDYAALAFARSFYVALASGRRIDEAVRSGRIGILGIARDTLEWITPVLYLGSDDTRLLDPEALGPPIAVSPQPPAAVIPPPPVAVAVAPTATETRSSSEPPAASAEYAIPTVPPVTPASAVTSTTESPRRRNLLIGGIAAALLVGGGVAWAVVAQLQPLTPVIADETSGPAPTGSPAPTPTILPAVTAAVAADQYWSPTWVTCDTGDVLEITATGELLHNGSPESNVTPEGLILADGTPNTGYFPFNVEGLPDTATASLIGSLDQQEPFAVGFEESYTCPRTGTLFLGINDTDLVGNSGSWQATIVRTDNPPEG